MTPKQKKAILEFKEKYCFIRSNPTIEVGNEDDDEGELFEIPNLEDQGAIRVKTQRYLCTEPIFCAELASFSLLFFIN